MPFAFTVSLSDPSHLAEDDALLADVQTAAGDWSEVLNGLGTLEIQVNVGPTPSGRASGGVGTVVALGSEGGRTTYQVGTLAELITGTDPNGGAPDVIVTVDPPYLQHELWLDPDPAHPQPVPQDRTDGLTVFRHELGHALGIIGFRDVATGLLPVGIQSTWDALVQVHADGTSWFTGAHARAAYGGDVPVTTLTNGEAYFHLGNGDDGASDDLMNGVTFLRGRTYGFSELDAAILQDLGASVTPRPVIVGDANHNVLVGTARGDVISGREGNDRLTGGPGSDAFLFDVKPKDKNADQLTDFTLGVDKLQLDHDIFKKLDVGDLPGKAFFAHKHADEAKDHKDRIVYDTKSGELWYDKDGKGGANAKLIAILDGSPDVGNSDILIVA